MLQFYFSLIIFLFSYPLAYTQTTTELAGGPFKEGSLSYTGMFNASVDVRLGPKQLGMLSNKVAMSNHTIYSNHLSVYWSLDIASMLYYKKDSFYFFGGSGGVGYTLFYDLRQDPKSGKKSGYFLNFLATVGGGGLVHSGNIDGGAKEVLSELGYNDRLTLETGMLIQNDWLWNNHGFGIETGVFYNIMENNFIFRLGFSYLMG